MNKMETTYFIIMNILITFHLKKILENEEQKIAFSGLNRLTLNPCWGQTFRLRTLYLIPWETMKYWPNHCMAVVWHFVSSSATLYRSGVEKHVEHCY